MQGQLQKAAQEWATLFTNFPVKKWWRAAPLWISVILVVLVAKSASELTWLVFAPDDVSLTGQQHAPPTSMGITTQQPRLRTVANLHLLGAASKKPVGGTAPIDAPKTGLKLTLRGVFATSIPERAMALIADARGKEKVYKKSEMIFSGVTLYEIYPDKVILERSGSFETLSLPRDKLGATRRPRTVSTRTTRPTTQATSSTVVRTRTVRAGKRLENLKKELAENPQKFWENVRIEPVYGNDRQIKGYKFNHKDRQMMRALGLRPGDVIVEVNGQGVSDPSVFYGLLGDLSSQATISLGIERNGHRENININM